MSRFIPAAVFLFCLFVSGLTLAQEDDMTGDEDQPAAAAPVAPGDETIAINPEAIGNDAGYAEAVKALSPEQQQYLSYLDDELAKVMEPNLQIVDMAGKLSYCMHNGQIGAAEKKNYAIAFISFRDQHNEIQADLWARHQALRDKATYIDRALLDNHAEFQAKSMLVMSGKMMQAAEKSGSYEKTDCKQVRATLDAMPPPASLQPQQQ